MTGAKSAASERMSDAKAAASERVTDARVAATERVTDAKTVATERVTEAKAAAGEFIAIAKPRLRGVSHEWAFFISLIAGGALIAAAPSGHARVAMAIYAFSLSGLLGTSALYHRVNWRRPEIRKWMRRLDHSMIFLLIAGTVTPFALLVMSGPLADALLIAVWAGALGRHRRGADLGRRSEVGVDDRLPGGRLDRAPRVSRDRRRAQESARAS